MKVDLHTIYNDENAVEEAIDNALRQAREHKVRKLEIVCGKGSGALKQLVYELLDRRGIQRRHQVGDDFAGQGVIQVFFDWNDI